MQRDYDESVLTPEMKADVERIRRKYNRYVFTITAIIAMVIVSACFAAWSYDHSKDVAYCDNWCDGYRPSCVDECMAKRDGSS